jgi:diguanylate cyclase (GGDEF)-like protein/PAS domain S-box-containing protein
MPYALAYVLFLVALVQTVWFALQYDRQQAVERAYEATTNLALAVERHFDGMMTVVDQGLQTLRTQYQQGGVPLTDTAFRRLDASFPGLISQFSITDADGMLIYSSLDPSPQRVSIRDRDHFRYHLTEPGDPLYLGKTVKGRVSGVWTMQVTRRYLTPEGRFAGVMVMSVSPDYFTAFFQRIALGGAGIVSIIGQDGYTRIRYSALNTGNEDAYTHPLPLENFRLAIPGRLHLISPFDGYRRQGAYSSSRVYPVNATVMLSEAEVLGQGQAGRNVVIFGSVLLALVALVCCVILGRRAVERLLAAERVQRQEERWRFALDAVGDGVWDWNPARGVLFLSVGWKAMLGYRDHELENSAESWESRLHPDDKAGTLRLLADHLDGNSPVYRSEHRLRCADGNYRWVLARGIVVDRDGQGRALRMIGTHTDVSLAKSLEIALRQRSEELEQAVSELRWLAETDVLTGVSNRRAFMARAEYDLTRSRRYDRPMVVAMLDIDHFKSVNDTYGHDGGDLVLRQVAAHCLARLRSTDFFGRIGGEEFAIVLTETGGSDAWQVLDDLRDSLAHRVFDMPDGRSMSVTVSIGMAQMHPLATTLDQMLKMADQGLYRAKREGRNRVIDAEEVLPPRDSQASLRVVR